MRTATMNNKTTCIIFFALLLFSASLRAQDKETKTIISEFMQACNLYKQQPLYLRVAIINTSSFVTREEDTLHAEAEFYLEGNNSYVRFGELEELVSDSMALLVSNKLGRMILYPNAGPVIARIKSMSLPGIQSGSEAEWAKKYKAEKEPGSGKGEAIITLESREAVYTTALPKQSIELQFDVQTKTPLTITAISRSLLPLDQAHYEILKEQPEYSEKLIKTDKDEYFLIKEQKAAFVYKEVRHEQNIKAPATIADRLSRKEGGSFALAKGYENYLLTVN